MSQEQNFFSILTLQYVFTCTSGCKYCEQNHVDWPCRCVTRVTFFFFVHSPTTLSPFPLVRMTQAQIEYSTPNHPLYQLQHTPLSLNSESWATMVGNITDYDTIGRGCMLWTKLVSQVLGTFGTLGQVALCVPFGHVCAMCVCHLGTLGQVAHRATWPNT